VRPAAAGAVLGLVLALGTPVAWGLGRPPAAVGAPVEQALGTPPAAASARAAPAAPVVARPAAPRPAAAGPVPAHLAVPARGIVAPVDPVGVAADGRMAVPEDVDRVGWYRFGPAPGTPGSAVLAGHVDDAMQGLGALALLRQVDIGDAVEVADTTGTTTRWRVVSRALVPKPELPLEPLFRRAGPPRLVLLTCGGAFDPAVRSYRALVVVVAEPAP
jgi:Sortase domain